MHQKEFLRNENKTKNFETGRFLQTKALKSTLNIDPDLENNNKKKPPSERNSNMCETGHGEGNKERKKAFSEHSVYAQMMIIIILS